MKPWQKAGLIGSLVWSGLMLLTCFGGMALFVLFGNPARAEAQGMMFGQGLATLWFLGLGMVWFIAHLVGKSREAPRRRPRGREEGD
jgi:hypothetical protein